MKGGLRISKKSRWREKETGGVVMAMFWLLHVGAVVRLRNFVVFVKKKKRVFIMERA